MAPTDGFDEETTLGDILSAGPQPTIEKGVTKSPTRKALQQAAQRKEAALRRVLAAQTRRGYVADHLVHPVCHGVLRRQDSTGEQLRLALEVIKRANCPPESERALADAIRAGLATRLDQSPSVDDDRAAPTVRLEAHLRLLAHAPPRLAAAILWADRQRLTAYIGRDSHTHGVNPGSRAAAIAAFGRCLSRSTALNSINASAPAGADATGACGEGASFARAVWHKILGVVSGASGEGGIDSRVAAAGFNACALLLGPALDGCHPTLPRLLAAHGPTVSDFGGYSGTVGVGDGAGGFERSENGDGGAAGGIATSADGDDPWGVSCPLLAALRLEAACHLVSRAAGVAERANGLPLEVRAVAVGALISATCAALELPPPKEKDENKNPDDEDEDEDRAPAPAAPPSESALVRLRDAGRTALPDVSGGLVDDLPALLEMGLRAAHGVGEGTLRPTLGSGPKELSYAAGIGLLALSGSLPRKAQPLDWASAACDALLTVYDAVPAVNGDAEWRELVDAEARDAANPKPKGAAVHAAAHSSVEALPRGCGAGSAVAPMSKASISFAIANALPSMPISQPLQVIRMLVARCRTGLAERPDLRVAVLARVLSTHARMRTHPEAIIVMSPVGEIISSYLDDDNGPQRAAAAAAAAVKAAEETAANEKKEKTGYFGGSSKIPADDGGALDRLRAEAARAAAAADAVQFREEIVVCAVEAILSLRPTEEEASGWCTVALEAAASLRLVPFWRCNGRRAAADAVLRLIARLCAVSKYQASLNKKPEAAGTHQAALRVLSALVEEATVASNGGRGVRPRLDDGTTAATAWLAARYLDFPTSGVAAMGEPGGPMGKLVGAMVSKMCAGGGGAASDDVANASAQQSLGTMRHPNDSSHYKNEAGYVASQAIAAVGVSCVDIMARRCPPLVPQLGAMLGGLLASPDGAPERMGHAAHARAKSLHKRFTAGRGEGLAASSSDRSAKSSDGTVQSPVPDAPPDLFPPSVPPPPLMMSHLARLEAVDELGRYSSRDLLGRAAAADEDRRVAAAAWRSLHGASAERVGFTNRADGSPASTKNELPAGTGYRSMGPRPEADRAPLTGTSDPCWIEASHQARPTSRTLTVSLRCRPAPASNAPNAREAAVASLAGTMTVGLHGAATFADGIGAVVAQLGSARLKSRSRQTTGPTYRGRGHAVQTHGSGSEEETTVTVDVRVFKFDRVSLRPVVAYDDGQSSLRAAAYEIPLTELLVPTPMSLPTFDRIWSALPATHSRAAKVHQHARSHPLRTAVRALGGELAPAVARLDDTFDSDLSHPRHVPLAHCGGYPLVAAGAACECFAACTWQGDYLLLCAFAAVGGVRLEYRARDEETLRPIVSNHADWLLSLTGNRLREVEDGDVGDDELFGHEKALSESDMASGPSDAPHGLIRLDDSVLQEWRSLAA
jgi:hypothetical protein